MELPQEAYSTLTWRDREHAEPWIEHPRQLMAWLGRSSWARRLVAQVPANTENDHIAIKMTACEQLVHAFSLAHRRF
jgi:hypothetical protein